MAKGRKISALSLFSFGLFSLRVATNKNAKRLLAYKTLSGWVHGLLYCPFGVDPLPSNLSSGKQKRRSSYSRNFDVPPDREKNLGVVRGAG